MEQMELNNKIAYLESLNDQLEAEICEIDSLMRQVGFSHGIATVKATVEELMRLKDQ